MLAPGGGSLYRSLEVGTCAVLRETHTNKQKAAGLGRMRGRLEVTVGKEAGFPKSSGRLDVSPISTRRLE